MTIDLHAIEARAKAATCLRGEDGDESDGDELVCEDCQESIYVDSDGTQIDPEDTILCHACEKARLRRSAEDVPALLEFVRGATAKERSKCRAIDPGDVQLAVDSALLDALLTKKITSIACIRNLRKQGSAAVEKAIRAAEQEKKVPR